MDTTHYERLTESRWGKYLSDIESSFIVDAAALAAPARRGLDVGADAGRWSTLLAAKGWKMICTDVDEESLALCKQRVADASVILVDETDESLPVETAGVHLLLCMEVPYVIESDWFLREAARVVAAGGYVVGVMNNRRSMRGIVYNLLLRRRQRGGYPYYQLSYPRWRRRLHDHGFEIVAEDGFCWFPMRRDSNSPLIPYAARIERFLGLHRLISLSPWVVFIARRTADSS